MSNEELSGTHEEGVSAPSSVGGSSITPPSTPGLQESGMSTTTPSMDNPGVPAAATGARNMAKKGCTKIITTIRFAYYYLFYPQQLLF